MYILNTNMLHRGVHHVGLPQISGLPGTAAPQCEGACEGRSVGLCVGICVGLRKSLYADL